MDHVPFSITDEWHQSFVPGREASWLDVAADGAGASLAAAGIAAWQRASGIAPETVRRMENE